jgi:hypothetical protein
MSALLWSYVTSGVFGLIVGAASTWWTSRRSRRRERRHEVRIRLVDLAGNDWLNVTCHELGVIRRYGGQDDPPWQTLETIGPRAIGFRLQVAPAHLD